MKRIISILIAFSILSIEKVNAEELTENKTVSACNYTGPSWTCSYTGPSWTRSDTQSYFTPGVGTKAITYGKLPMQPTLYGELLPSRLAVASDIGTEIAIFDYNGSVVWQRFTYPNTVRGTSFANNLLSVPIGKSLFTLDIDTLSPAKNEVLDDSLLFYVQQDDHLITGKNDKGLGAVSFDGRALPIATSYARDALLYSDILYIADTFNHRVVAFDLSDWRQVREYPAYYPNAIHESVGEIFVTEEHANRVVNILTGEIAFGCPISAYTNTSSPFQGMEPSVSHFVDKDGIGRCAREYMGPHTLYSPNDSVEVDATLVVTDTLTIIGLSSSVRDVS
jgi:hypothetical protein